MGDSNALITEWGEVLALNSQFDWEPMPDGSFIFSQENGLVVTIDPLAELTLSFFDGETSLRNVFQALNEQRELSREEFQRLVAEFKDQKILLIVGG